MVRFVVGVDTGKRRHRAAVYDRADARWAGELSFPVSRVGFDRLVAFVRGVAPEPAAVLVGVEAAGHYHLTLVEHLRAAGCPVVLLDPYRATQFRRSEGHRAKTDRLDARALARFLAGRAPRADPLPARPRARPHRRAEPPAGHPRPGLPGGV
jgi:transposase